MTPVLLPLYVHPSLDPLAWRAVAALPKPVTVVVDSLDGDSLDGDSLDLDEAVAPLVKAGVAVLGRVDAGFATRPVADLLDDVVRWAGHPVSGVYLDQAPTSPFSLGPIALATRVARRSGLSTVLLNPGIATDPLYRELGAEICTFEGSWAEYRRWSGEGSLPGDGHLVHSVPLDAFDQAHALFRSRGAGWGLVTDRTPPAPYAGLPTSWAGPGLEARPGTHP